MEPEKKPEPDGLKGFLLLAVQWVAKVGIALFQYYTRSKLKKEGNEYARNLKATRAEKEAAIRKEYDALRNRGPGPD